jgi:DNA-binding response OmpR family regulator
VDLRRHFSRPLSLWPFSRSHRESFDSSVVTGRLAPVNQESGLPTSASTLTAPGNVPEWAQRLADWRIPVVPFGNSPIGVSFIRWLSLITAVSSTSFMPATRWTSQGVAMSAIRQRVLAIELYPDLADLVQEILTEAGYDVTTVLCSPTASETAKTLNPDVIVLDLGLKTHTCGWDLLASLRSDQDTQGIPLLVTSDTDQLLEDAKRSFNVRQELVKPYNIDDLVQGIQAAISGTALLPHPAGPPTTGPLSALAANTIASEGDAIMVSWLRRVQHEKVLGPTQTTQIRLLMNDVSTWLIGLVSVLRYGPNEVSGRSEIRNKVQRHVEDARRRRIDLAQIIKQFEILRDEVWLALERAQLNQLATADVFALGRSVNSALDDVLFQIAHEYMVIDPPLVGKTTKS